MIDAPLTTTDLGLYCAAGDFYVDPWRPVPRAVVTHAHADHACWGCGRYLTSTAGKGVLQTRMGASAVIDTLDVGVSIDLNGVDVSLYPAGHILGSSQVRIEHKGHVLVVSGDYKTGPDATCDPFEPVRCHTFLTESTFGLPIYRWPPQSQVFGEINAWWRRNQAEGKASLLLAYALGKSQRLLSGLDPSIGPIYAHGAVEKLNRDYRAAGIPLPPTSYVGSVAKGHDWSKALIVAPPSAYGGPWSRKFGPLSAGFASGWMMIRGTRRRKAVDRGFVLSDHVDWESLLGAIDATGAESVWVTHGYSAVVVKWLRERGMDARSIATRYEDEVEEKAEADAEGPGGVEDEPSLFAPPGDAAP